MAQTICSRQSCHDHVTNDYIRDDHAGDNHVANEDKRTTYCWDAPFGALNVVVRTKLAFRGQYWRQRIA